MATTAFCGQNGSVLVGTHEVLEIGAWNLTISRAPIDVPKFGTSRDKILCGPYEWTGDFTGNWWMDDTAGQKALYLALVNGTTSALKLYVDAADYYSGTAYISQVAVATPHDGIVSVTYNFVGSGDLSLTQA